MGVTVTAGDGVSLVPTIVCHVTLAGVPLPGGPVRTIGGGVYVVVAFDGPVIAAVTGPVVANAGVAATGAAAATVAVCTALVFCCCL